VTLEAAGSTKILVSVTLCPTSDFHCGHLLKMRKIKDSSYINFYIIIFI